MLDNAITLGLLGLSIAGTIVSVMARRRRQQKLATLSDEDLLAVLGNLQATNASITPHERMGPELVSHPTAEMRDAIQPKSVRSSTEFDEERRRITVLIIDEMRRRERGREYH